MRHSRIIHFPTNFKPDDDPHTKAVYDLIHTREMEVDALHPLEVFLDRDFLISEVELSIQSIHEKFDWQSATEVQKEYVQSALQQRAEFLEQLKTERTQRVYVCVYLKNTDPELGLGEDDDEGEPLDIDPDDYDPISRYGDFGDLGKTLETDLPL